MIKSVDKLSDFYEICRDEPFGTRVASLYLTYGNNCRFADFWYQISEENSLTAAISKVSGDITLCLSETADFEELKEFLKIIGYSSVTYNSKFDEALSLLPNAGGLIVGFSGTAKAESEHDTEVKNYAELSDVYDLISSQGVAFLSDKLFWISDASQRLKNKTAELGVIFDGGKLASCAMILFETEHNAFLGAVATYPKYRGNGYARKILHKLLQNGKKSFLFCRNDDIINFYKEIGFEPIGKFSVSECK